MHRTFAALVAIMLAASPAFADCKSEVTAAFEKQRKAPAFRLVAQMASDTGTTEVVADYMPPDRMYQKIVVPGQPAPLETIAIGKSVWGTQGGGWEELQPHMAQSVTAHVRQTLADPAPESGDFTCLGKQTLNGKEYLAYRSVNAAPPAANEPVFSRTVYLEPESGMPAVNVVAAEKPDATPVFKGVYTYPADIKIEAPFGGP